ncbi:MAG: hypothetical protein V1787_06765 [Candidatus Micrarchaeota archaeon]
MPNPRKMPLHHPLYSTVVVENEEGERAGFSIGEQHAFAAIPRATADPLHEESAYGLLRNILGRYDGRFVSSMDDFSSHPLATGLVFTDENGRQEVIGNKTHFAVGISFGTWAASRRREILRLPLRHVSDPRSTNAARREWGERMARVRQGILRLMRHELGDWKIARVYVTLPHGRGASEESWPTKAEARTLYGHDGELRAVKLAGGVRAFRKYSHSDTEKTRHYVHLEGNRLEPVGAVIDFAEPQPIFYLANILRGIRFFKRPAGG